MRPFLSTLVLLCAVGAGSAAAAEQQPVEPAPIDAPAAGDTSGSLDAPPAVEAPASPEAASAGTVRGTLLAEARPAEVTLGVRGLEFAGGAAAAIVTVPGSAMLASWMGTWSSNLILGALPPLLFFALVPPLAVTVAELLLADSLVGSSSGLSPTYYLVTGAHVAIMVGAILLGAHTGNFAHLSILTLVEALVLPAVANLTLHAGEQDRTVAAWTQQRRELDSRSVAAARAHQLPQAPLFALSF